MPPATSGSPEPKFPNSVHLLTVGRTHSYADADDAAKAVADDPTAIAVDTSTKRSGYLSFTLRPLPEISYLYLHWPYDPASAPAGLSALSSILSVDEDLLLISIDQYPSGTDLFVYTAHSASSPPSLRRLPACDEEIQGVAGRTRFFQLRTDIGIVRCGGDEDDYVVADLVVSLKASVEGFREDSCYDDPATMRAVLCTFTPKTGQWKVKEMHAPQPQDQDQFPILWSCDSVVPFANRYLCWVDYYSGLLIRDFSDKDSPCLTYVPFPAGGKQYSDDTRVERIFPESFRRVAVSQGMLCFIHIGDDYCQEAGVPCQSSELTITVRNLDMTTSHGNWDVCRVVKFSDIWAQPCYQYSNLPRRRLAFPLMTMDDPDLLCCVLREEGVEGRGI